jgi:hypothetical protein
LTSSRFSSTCSRMRVRTLTTRSASFPR